MLNEVNFLHSYSSGFDEPKEFFTEALMESNSFDLGLGFFSSSGIRSLACGFAMFIANGGRMRIVINNILSPEDKEAIKKGQEHTINFEAHILSDITRLFQTLSREDKHFFECLSYLISIKRIEFVATTSTKGGIGHDKYGVFTDEKGNRVAFIGSANFSQSALDFNGETITVFTSPTDDNRINEYQELFSQSWENDTPHLIHIPIDEVKTHIQELFPTPHLDELLRNEKDIIKSLSTGSPTTAGKYVKPLSQRLVDKFEAKELEPRFPFPEERTIQKDAYNAWIANDKSGVFAMATGSGKTVTALNCVLKQYKENGFYKAIIVVPTQALALQWQKEAETFNFQNIISIHTDKDWKDTLERYISHSLLNTQRNLILITTYATFNRKTIQSFLERVKGIDTFMYIADEAHNIGSSSSLRHLPHMIKWRIGLSATPERIYDDVGSKKLYDFFNSYPPTYTYRFTMKQAIENGILCHYEYYPIFVELTLSEMEEYNDITKQLRKYIDPDTGKYKDEKEVEFLLLKRKRVVHKATKKKDAINELLQHLEKQKRLDYTFVFVPEGYEPDYSTQDSYAIEPDDIHIIDEYAEMFKEQGYSYHKYISGLDDAPSILKNFADGDIQILLSMKCLDEGVDIPRAEHAIFCSSTGNPRQFVQRRGRVLRKDKNKEYAKIWDLIVIPPSIETDASIVERNLFKKEVERIVNFAVLADNQFQIMCGELNEYCELLGINQFTMLEEENNQYN